MRRSNLFSFSIGSLLEQRQQQSSQHKEYGLKLLLQLLPAAFPSTVTR
ncbi:hypothetical protein ABEO99_10535 [Bacillus pumilus]